MGGVIDDIDIIYPGWVRDQMISYKLAYSVDGEAPLPPHHAECIGGVPVGSGLGLVEGWVDDALGMGFGWG